MSQFMYHFFRENAERPQQVIQDVYNFLNGLKANLNNSDVSLFSLILRNEIDESFAEPYYQIKLRLEELLRYHVRNQNEGVSVKELNELVEEKRKNEISLDVTLEIINKMYKDDHPNKIIVLSHFGEVEETEIEAIDKGPQVLNVLKKFSTHNRRQKIKKSKSKLKHKLGNQSKFKLKDAPGMASFQKLEKAVLMTELKNRRKYLKFVKREFRKFDPQNLGFILKVKVKNLLMGLYKNENLPSEAKQLVKKHKESEIKNITFSQVVYMLENSHLKDEPGSMSQLENIYNRNVKK
jgi:hypothetical protein